MLCIADDITVYVEVNTMSEAVADHDCKLFSLLQRCRDRNLNKEKIRLLLPEVQLVGHFITKYGLKPDLANELTLQCDASGIGLGSYLIQNSQPIAYASHTLMLMDTEKQYTQIEIELLAVMHELTHFHQYAYGPQVMYGRTISR